MPKYVLLSQIKNDEKKHWWEEDKFDESVKIFDNFNEAKVAMRQTVTRLTMKYEKTQVNLHNTCDYVWPFTGSGNIIRTEHQEANNNLALFNKLIYNLVCDPEYVYEDVSSLDIFVEHANKNSIIVGNSDCIICSFGKRPRYKFVAEIILKMNIHNMSDNSKSYYFYYEGVSVRLLNVDTVSEQQKDKKSEVVEIPDRVYLGKYMSNAAGTKFDPLLWWVIKRENDAVMIITDLVIDYKQFSSTCETTWEQSDLRKWLNSTFFDTAFDAQEKSIIYEHTVGEKVSLLDSQTFVQDWRASCLSTNFARKAMQLSNDYLPYNYHYPSRIAYWVKDTEINGINSTACYKYCESIYNWVTAATTPTKFGGVRPIIWIKEKDLIKLADKKTAD